MIVDNSTAKWSPVLLFAVVLEPPSKSLAGLIVLGLADLERQTSLTDTGSDSTSIDND